MSVVTSYLTNIVRSEGDPKIISSGPSSLSGSDQVGRFLGWFSLGLGALELFAPRRITQALGAEGSETLVQAYGVREIAAGMLTLSTERTAGLWARVAGDGLDIATLSMALDERNPKRQNVGLAIAMVVGVMVLDIVAAQSNTVRYQRDENGRRQYQDRSGFPQGLEKARGAAKQKAET